jgi:hypothetical protein
MNTKIIYTQGEPGRKSETFARLKAHCFWKVRSRAFDQHFEKVNTLQITTR